MARSAGVVIGVGNAWASDDGAGILVARDLRGRLPEGTRLVEHEGDPTALLDLWRDTAFAVVVDAVSGGGRPGSVTVWDASAAALPSRFTGPSTHAFSVGQAIELARSLGRMPERLLVVGVEGRCFDAGAEPSAAVAGAIPEASSIVLAELERWAARADP